MKAESIFYSKIRKTCVYEIPFFQRPYVWNDKNWSSLIESINKTPNNMMPYLGSFIVKEVKGKNNHYLLIDGQQRFTTLAILVQALIDSFYGTDVYKDKVTSQYIYNLLSLVYNVKQDFRNGEFVTVKSDKYIPSKNDKAYFDKIVNKSLSKPVDIDLIKDINHPIIKAYLYFFDIFSKMETQEKANFSSKILSECDSLIEVVLDSFDDEQEIFDMVNSKGKKLTSADIIKNYLFQTFKNLAEPHKYKLDEVYKLYDDCWEAVFYGGGNDPKRYEFWSNEIVLGKTYRDNIELFLKDYATIKGIYVSNNNSTLSGMADLYKSYIDTLDYDGIKELVLEIKDYANIYYEYRSNYSKTVLFNRKDNSLIMMLITDKLDTNTFSAYILELLKTNPSNLKDKLFELERFVIFRLLCHADKKNYNRVCMELLKYHKEGKNTAAYLNEYNNSQSLSISDVFTNSRNLKNNEATLILFLTELLTITDLDDNAAGLSYEYSLEHIMPKKWETNWKSSLVYDSSLKQVNGNSVLIDSARKSMIQSLGNLTLITSKFNSSLKNKGFSLKVEGTKNDGYRANCKLNISKYIINTYDSSKDWTGINIYEREKEIIKILNDYYKF